MDEKSSYNPITKTYHCTTPAPTHLPPDTSQISTTSYTLSLLTTSPFFSPSSPALIDAVTGHSLSFSHLLRQLHSLSSSLTTLLPPTSSSSRHVALILSPPSLNIPVLYLSLLSLNVVVSPANPLLTPHELAHLVSLSKPSVIFTVSSLSSKLRGFGLPLVFLDSPDFQALLDTSEERVVKNETNLVLQTDTAMILYSSGTTGKVKGVELTHRNLIALLSSMKQARDDWHKWQEGKGETPQRGVGLIPIPLFHVYGVFMLLRCVALADTLVMMERFDFEKMLVVVEKYRVTYIPVAPPLMVAMVKSELTRNYDLSSLESVGCGGAPLSKEVAESFKAKFPNVVIIQGYGMTETAGGGARSPGPDEPEPCGSVGRLFDLLEAKIVDPSTGEALPPGQQGELWLRGPTIMKGYVGDREATAATISPDGWMKTGDLCYFDKDGYLYIVDRLKELIKYKGYQVPPAELEQLLLSHPEIDDAAVVPYPDEEAGQIPMAFVVRKPKKSITASQVMDYVAKQVSPYKKIRRVAFVNSIPKNPSGKILRRELVNQAISNTSKL